MEDVRNAPAWSGHIPCSLLQLKGNDALDLLQRISTNDVAGMTDGTVRKTLLVSDKGRLIDTIWVVLRGTELLLVCSTGMSGTVQQFLERYIIMDDVTVHDLFGATTVRIKIGTGSEGLPVDYFGHPGVIIFKEPHDAPESETAGFELWRILNGIPVAGREVVQDFNPLELDLWDWISFTKGCYIGQEVIARLDTYQKIQRSLCLVSGTGRILEGTTLQDQSGKEVGRVTSIVQNGNTFIGLAVVRRSAAVANTRLQDKTGGTSVTVEQVFQKEKNGTD
ncbi:MAG: hypothetical protein HUU02_16635 [Bacteroidetes bacterium]|nr:hypothetical protein [Bacteroidota bacterium]